MPRRLTRSRGKKLQKNKLHKKDRTSSGHAMKKTLVERYSTNFCVIDECQSQPFLAFELFTTSIYSIGFICFAFFV